MLGKNAMELIKCYNQSCHSRGMPRIEEINWKALGTAKYRPTCVRKERIYEATIKGMAMSECEGVTVNWDGDKDCLGNTLDGIAGYDRLQGSVDGSASMTISGNADDQVGCQQTTRRWIMRAGAGKIGHNNVDA